MATEIAARCLNYGWRELGLASIVALTRPDNLPSQRVMSKIGMHFDRERLHEGEVHVLYRVNVASPLWSVAPGLSRWWSFR